MTVSREGVRQGATRGEVFEAQLLVGAQVVQTQGACSAGACVSRPGATVIAVAPNAVTKRRRDKSFRLRKRVTAKPTTATGAGS